MNSPEMVLIAMDDNKFTKTEDFQGKLDHHFPAWLHRGNIFLRGIYLRERVRESAHEQVEG